MSLEDLGNIGEFVAAVAVVISLIYLAVQIRQNTAQTRQNIRVVRASAFQNITDRVTRWNDSLAGDPELARIYASGLLDPRSLNDVERIRFETHAGNAFRHWEDIFLLRRDGLVDDEVWEARKAQWKVFFAEPGMKWIWGRRKASMVSSFQAFIDTEIDAPLPVTQTMGFSRSPRAG
jgi:hypothetical protein